MRKRKLQTVILVLFCMFSFLAAPAKHLDAQENPFNDVSTALGNTTYKAILWAYDRGIVKGTSATTFSPKADCTRANLCVMLYRLYDTQYIDMKLSEFKDITSLGKTNRSAIVWANINDIVKGTSQTAFSPYNGATRANIVVMLYRLANSPDVETGYNPFLDVKSSMGTTTYKAILWAFQNGITKGTSTSTFAPNEVCTRAQIAVFLYRFYQQFIKPMEEEEQALLPDYQDLYKNSDLELEAMQRIITQDLIARGFTNFSVDVIERSAYTKNTIAFQTPPKYYPKSYRIRIKIIG